LETSLPSYSHTSQKDKDAILAQILRLNAIIIKVILPDNITITEKQYLSKIYKTLGLKTPSTTQPKKASNETMETLWEAIELNVMNNIKSYILKTYTNNILKHFAMKLGYIVKQYAKYLPAHVAQSERDDLTTISQLEFLETFKAWKPSKCEEIWPLAYTRINGAMKDHIRYVSKSDPSRFYDWITDAAYIYMSQSNDDDFEYKIETGIELREAMKVLTFREKRIVIAYTNKDLTFQTISKKLGLSESQTSRLYKKALEKIKKELTKAPSRL